MKPKKIVSVVLLAFVAVSLGWLFFPKGQSETTPAETRASGESSADPAPATNPPASTNRVIVYYFHTTYRCPACTKIENYTQEAVNTGFAEALREGRLEFHSIDVTDPSHAHFIQDYQLSAKSVIVSELRDGREARWKNLTRVWRLTRNKGEFMSYIRDEVNLYLQGQ